MPQFTVDKVLRVTLNTVEELAPAAPNARWFLSRLNVIDFDDILDWWSRLAMQGRALVAADVALGEPLELPGRECPAVVASFRRPIEVPALLVDESNSEVAPVDTLLTVERGPVVTRRGDLLMRVSTAAALPFGLKPVELQVSCEGRVVGSHLLRHAGPELVKIGLPPDFRAVSVGSKELGGPAEEGFPLPLSMLSYRIVVGTG